MHNPELQTRTAVLIDVDGTTSNTAEHMAGLNERLINAFPLIAEALPAIREKRRAFRKELGHLSFSGQDKAWQQRYPGTTSHSQLDIYRTFAPDVFDDQLTNNVYEWLQDTRNFGHAEYDDTAPMLAGLQQLGALPVIFTLGQKHVDRAGRPGWQRLKIDSAPNLRSLHTRIEETLPEGGKGAIIAQSYDETLGTFLFPLDDTDGVVSSEHLVMVDDSIDNLDLPPQALGVLVDRTGKYSEQELVTNIEVVTSLREVPAIVARYQQST
ncbi:MAG TPA: hypothetical protein VLA92_02260 [Candidatus Saccharimonadales bacterium]|nr:hypothetical protein [Candidatus Saccharimonadales bacterium]